MPIPSRPSATSTRCPSTRSSTCARRRNMPRITCRVLSTCRSCRTRSAPASARSTCNRTGFLPARSARRWWRATPPRISKGRIGGSGRRLPAAGLLLARRAALGILHRHPATDRLARGHHRRRLSQLSPAGLGGALRRGFPARIVLIDGGTGTAKTRLLGHLADQGAQILDLEDLAAHRGSVFRLDGRSRNRRRKGSKALLADQVRHSIPRGPSLSRPKARASGDQPAARAGHRDEGRQAVRITAPLGARVGHLMAEYADLGPIRADRCHSGPAGALSRA